MSRWPKPLASEDRSMLETLKQGREAYVRLGPGPLLNTSLSLADESCPLGADDLELLGNSVDS